MERLITVKGVSNISVKPDLIIITMNVVSEKYDYDEAMELATESIESLENAIEKINTYDKKPQGLENIYYDYIIEISNNEKVPLEIILAIITTENITYNADACYKNSNGTTDMGLCQINSAYVDYFAKTYNIENFDPFNEKHAITFVARHMKYLSDYGKIHFNLSEIDSYIFAAGAYNRGLSNECKYRNMYEYKEKFLMNYNNLI